MRYQIYLKDEPVSVEPDTYYPTEGAANEQALQLEYGDIRLKGKLEVRPVEQP